MTAPTDKKETSARPKRWAEANLNRDEQNRSTPMGGSVIQPHSKEAEEHILAVCLLDNGDTLNRALSDGVTETSFHLPENRTIFSAMLKLHRAGIAPELQLLSEELQTQNLLERVGGMPYLVQVTGKIPTTAHYRHYLDKLITAESLRRAIREATEIIETAQTFNGTAAEFDVELEARCKDIVGTKPGSSLLLEKLASRRLMASSPVPKPTTSLYLAGKPIATPGNLCAMIARAKSGKTASVGAIIAAAVGASLGARGLDTLKFSASNPEGKGLVLIDTEQSKYDAYACFMRALRRAETETDPDWLYGYGLAGFTAEELRRLLVPLLERVTKERKGIFAAVLDGVADFVNDPNNPLESNPFVAELQALAIRFDCPIVCVIHSNEGQKSGDDGRGHLGKQLARKAESNLLLKKVGDVTTITSGKQRNAPITESDGVAFKWSDDEGRHVTCASPATAKDENAKEELRLLAAEVFGADRNLRRMELEKRIADARNVKGNTPSRRVDKMMRLGVVRNSGFGNYERIT